jgi:hypothetical protein
MTRSGDPPSVFKSFFGHSGFQWTGITEIMERIMSRLLAFVFALLLLGAPVSPVVAQAPANQQQQQTKEQIVYITRV